MLHILIFKFVRKLFIKRNSKLFQLLMVLASVPAGVKGYFKFYLCLDDDAGREECLNKWILVYLHNVKKAIGYIYRYKICLKRTKLMSSPTLFTRQEVPPVGRCLRRHFRPEQGGESGQLRDPPDHSRWRHLWHLLCPGRAKRPLLNFRALISLSLLIIRNTIW